MTDVRKILAASAEMQRRFAALRVRMPPTVAVPRLLGPTANIPKVVVPAFAVQQQLRPCLELQDQWKGLVFKTPPWASAFRVAEIGEHLRGVAEAAHGNLDYWAERS